MIKFVCSIIFSLFVFYPVLAGTPQQDSARSFDKERINAILSSAGNVRNNNPQHAIELYKQALELAELQEKVTHFPLAALNQEQLDKVLRKVHKSKE